MAKKEQYHIDYSFHGFVFGKYNGIRMDKPEDQDGHILIVGGAGSGKSSCLSIPSLRIWQERVFCIDIKGELYEKTRNARQQTNHEIKVFNPLQDGAFGYDPFYLLGKAKNKAQEAEAIAMALVPLPPDVKEPFWIKSAQYLLTGIILHYYSAGVHFIETMKEVQSKYIGTIVDNIYKNSKSDEAKFYVNTFVYMPDDTLASVFSELSHHIMIFATDSDIKNCLSKEACITPDDLENGRDIYICIPEYLLRQWKNLLTLMVSQFLRHFEKRPDMEAKPILFLLDEFARLGKIEGITEAFATLRSKKITICTIIQSLAQLDLIYNESTRRVIVDNCQYKAVLGATDADSQEYFSRLVGTYDKLKIGSNENFGKFGFRSGSGKSATTEIVRVIKLEEFAMLDVIVYFSPDGTFILDKVPYYLNENLK